jgi:Ca2+/Na+ antiporter
MDPYITTPTFVWILTIIFYPIAIMGAEWATDSLCTLALGLKVNPLVTGLIIPNLMGALPIIVFTAVLAHIGNSDGAMGVTLGGSWIMTIIPLALAGIRVPITARPSWISIDLPILAVCVVLFIFLFTSDGDQNIHVIVLIAACVGYAILKYIQAQENRYSASDFGRNFIFGVSIINTLARLAMGLILLMGASLYLGRVFAAAQARWHLPGFALGLIAALPFCLPEIKLAQETAKAGQGELLPGRGIWLGILALLLGGAAISLFHQRANSNCFNFSPLGIVAILLCLWTYLRIKRGVFQGISSLLLLVSILLLAVVWAQGYGLLTEFALPRTFEILQ